MDASTMGDQFLPTAAGILGALGDVASVHFCPAVPSRASMGEGGAEAVSYTHLDVYKRQSPTST